MPSVDYAVNLTVDAVTDYVCAEDYEDAVVLCGFYNSPDDARAPWVGPIGEQWRKQAIQHLIRKAEALFRDTPAIRTEQQAMAMIREIAHYLDDAGSALRWAAERLKNNKPSDPYGANQTMKAAQQAKAHAQELIGA